MKSNTLPLLKVLMWVIAGMHVVVGAGLNLAPGFAQFMAEVYGAEVNWTPELSYIIKPLGAFMFALGILAIAAALDPSRYRIILYGFVILFLARALQRLLWAQEIQEAFGISASRNNANMIFFAFLALAVTVLDQLVQGKKNRQTKGTSET